MKMEAGNNNVNSPTKGKCPQGVCSREGKYITHHNRSNGNDMDTPLATCDCGRKYNSLWGLWIHKAPWCKQRNSPIEECKSNDGFMNQEHPHSIKDPIAERKWPGDFPSKPRIQCSKSNQTIATRHNIKSGWTRSILVVRTSVIYTHANSAYIKTKILSFCTNVVESSPRDRGLDFLSNRHSKKVNFKDISLTAKAVREIFC